MAQVAQPGPEDAEAVLAAAAKARGDDVLTRLTNGDDAQAVDAVRAEWAVKLALAEAEAGGA